MLPQIVKSLPYVSITMRREYQRSDVDDSEEDISSDDGQEHEDADDDDNDMDGSREGCNAGEEVEGAEDPGTEPSGA